MSKRVPVVRCQQRLLILWSALTVLAVVVLLVQSTPNGVYYRQAAELWDWLLPIVVPTLSLMVGTIIAQAMAEDSTATASQFAYRLALIASSLYLLLVIGLLLLFAEAPDVVSELKKLSKLIAALQAIVGLSLGAFFVSKKS